jgi:hypothetical protein
MATLKLVPPATRWTLSLRELALFTANDSCAWRHCSAQLTGPRVFLTVTPRLRSMQRLPHALYLRL